MQVEERYDYYEVCCDDFQEALDGGKIDFDDMTGDFYFVGDMESLKKCPYCHQKINKIENDF